MDPITNITELLEAIDTYYVTPSTEKITGVETNAVLHAMIELLPPAEPTLTDGEIKDYLMTLPGYGPDKMLASDFTWVSYDPNLPQLSAVTGFALSDIGTDSITINWHPVNNAGYYILQQDNSEQFNDPATIYTGPANSFTVTDLLPAYTYYFRIKAVAISYQDSAFAVATATTLNT